jgi:hypothetical protein
VILRIVPVIGVVACGLLVGSCSSVGPFVGDNLPAWAGGLPAGTPPRPGTPGYDAYLKSIRGNAPAESTAEPPRPVNPQPRKSREPVDEPIH